MDSLLIKALWRDIHNRGCYIGLLLKSLNILPGESGDLLRGYALGKVMRSVGINARINSGSIIFHPNNMEIGNNFFMNAHCLINAAAGIVCGDDVLIGPDVKIWTINHEFGDTETPINQQGWSKESVCIGNDVWVGASVVILPGSKIPDGVVIGASSLVTKKTILEPYCVYAGNPVQKIKSRAKSPTKK